MQCNASSLTFPSLTMGLCIILLWWLIPMLT